MKNASWAKFLMKTMKPTLKVGAFVFGVAISASAQAAIEDDASSADRGPASEAAPQKEEAKVDPVTRALYQSLDERARSQRDFERHEALGRPKESHDKKQLRIDLGDELGGGAFPIDRGSRQVRARGLEFGETIPAIESRLDMESREAREEVRREKAEARRDRHTREMAPRRAHWIDN